MDSEAGPQNPRSEYPSWVFSGPANDAADQGQHDHFAPGMPESVATGRHTGRSGTPTDEHAPDLRFCMIIHPHHAAPPDETRANMRKRPNMPLTWGFPR